MALFYSHPQQTFQEVPGEIILALSISGCNLRCRGCHSQETFDPNFGTELTTYEIDRLLKKFRHTSCVLFYGGEWDTHCLISIANFIKSKGLKVCLYSGRNLSFFNEELLNQLDFIKVGAYVEKWGNLTNPKTNQRFYKIIWKTLVDKTNLFHSG